MRADLCLLLLVACKSAPSEPADEELPPAAVTCAAIVQTTVDEVVEVDGVIAPPPTLDAVISSPVAGRLAKLTVEEGDHVMNRSAITRLNVDGASAGVTIARVLVSK